MNLFIWNTAVNQNFYAYSKKPNDNAVVSSFLSGRVTGFKRNSHQNFTFTCKLKLTKEEEAGFWEWFEAIGTTVGAFSCEALGNGYFRFVSIPSPDGTDQKWTILNMEIEQVN